MVAKSKSSKGASRVAAAQDASTTSAVGKTSTTTSLTIRIDRDLKSEAELLAAKFGTNLNNAVNILLAGFVRNYAFPEEYMRARRESVEEIAVAMQEAVDMEYEEIAGE